MSDPIEQGTARLDWVCARMTLLAETRAAFAQQRPFAGLAIGVSLHIEPKTVVLLETLMAGGARIVGVGNHSSTQDDMVAVLRAAGATIFGARDDDWDTHQRHVARVVEAGPDILLDNGADLVAHAIAQGRAPTIRGGTEETTSGGNRLRTAFAGQVPFPVIVINDSPIKQIAENQHAVGQSVAESFMRLTNLMVNGRRFVVLGYGWCGRGIAHYLRALGGHVGVVETDEIKAMEAALAGFRVADLPRLAPWGEVFVTATACPGVLGPEAFARMASGAVLANAGHFPTEIDAAGLRGMAQSTRMIEQHIEAFDLPDGRRICLVAGGRMMNLAGREPRGNSIGSMDFGFTLQALSLARVATAPETLRAGPQPVADDINRTLARRIVAMLGDPPAEV